jgi:hypothetical protein
MLSIVMFNAVMLNIFMLSSVVLNEGKSAASFCGQVVACVPEMF